MIDLHTHSTASDGSLSPRELVQLASDDGLLVLALTDHDILDGIPEAEQVAKDCNIIFIRGIEISVNWQPGEFHLLGLDLRKNSDELNKLIAKLQQNRINRNIKIAEKLQSENFDITYEKVKNFVNQFKGANSNKNSENGIGRPHFAQYMTFHKMVKNPQVAFDKYLGKHCPCFVEKENVEFEEAISAINSAGGIPVLAHPMSLYLSWSSLPKTILDLKMRGLIGIEAWNSSTRCNDCRRLELLASEYNMISTAGSDFHGSIRKGRRLGYTAGQIKIENRFYKALRTIHTDLPQIFENTD